MTIRHHLDEEIILAYAAGALDEATSLLVATHMALCPRCRSALSMGEAVGGALLETLPPADIDASMMAAILAEPEAPAPEPRRVRPAEGSCVLPRPLRDYVGGDVDRIRWRSLGGGVKHMPLVTSRGGSKARLLYIPAEAAAPEHGHRGMELTLVLAGSFHDGGAWFRRGDVETADPDIEHQPVAGPDEDCICLAVTDAPLRFRGLLPRLAQPFLGI